MIWAFGEAECFCGEGWTWQIRLNCLNKWSGSASGRTDDKLRDPHQCSLTRWVSQKAQAVYGLNPRAVESPAVLMPRMNGIVEIDAG